MVGPLPLCYSPPMLQTDSRVIGQHTYHVSQLGASVGRKLLVKLLKVLGPSFGELLGGAEKAPGAVKAFSVADVKVEALTRALEKLGENLTDTDLEYVCTVMGGATMVEYPDGRQLPLSKEMQELHFAGAYGEMFRWLGFCLEVNYASFFDGWPQTGASSQKPNQEKGTSE